MIAAIYTRVSTDEQRREGHSLDAQARLCRERAESEGYDVPDVYSEALSGAKSDRPEYQRLLADAASGKFEAVYVWKFDRLGRDAEELLRARRMLEAAGVRLVSVTEGEEESNLIYGVRALVAQEEREKISERTRIGLEEVAAGGRALGPAPLGYRHVPGERDRAGRWLPGKEPRWLVHDDEAEIVRRAHELYRAGVGVNRVAATLNEEGYRTRRGSKFSARVILDLLGHPAYIGSVRFRGEIVAEGVHEPILDRETYEEVRRLREARRESPSKGRGRLPKGSHLLTRGMLRCGRCGSAMAPKTSAEGYERYRCGRRRTYGDCAMPDLARARVDEAVFAYFERAALDVEGTVAELTVEARRRIAQTQSLAEQAERQAVEIEQGRERADRAFLSGAIEEKDYRRLLAQVEEEGPAARAEAERLRAQVAALEEELAELDAETVVAERLAEIRRSVVERVTSAESVEAIRAALVSLFEHFTLTLDEETGDFALEPIIRPDVLELQPVLDPATLTEAERLAEEGLDFEEIGERLRLPEGWQDEPAVRVALRRATLRLGEKIGAEPPSP